MLARRMGSSKPGDLQYSLPYWVQTTFTIPALAMPGTDRFSGDRPHNPFKIPQARVAVPSPKGQGPLLDPPRGVETGRGFAWFGEGFELFREAPGTWIVITLVWVVLNVMLGFIPGASSLLNPVLIGGLMFGCQALSIGNEFGLECLFQGFRRNFGTLMLISLLGIAGAVAIVAVGAAIVMASGFGEILLNPQMTTELDQAALLPSLLLAALVVLALAIPLAMALWFAPGLAILHDVSALASIGLSFRGCLRNLLPFLAYGIAGLALAILATLPLGLGWLVLMPVIITSTYAAYRDIFLE